MYVGFQFFYAFYSHFIKSKHEAIVLLSHWTLINNNYLCVGQGDSETLNEVPSEGLPDRWNMDNGDRDAFVLRYKSKDGTKRLSLKIVRQDDYLVVSVLLTPENTTATFQIRPGDFISNRFINYYTAFANENSPDEFDAQFRREILDVLKQEAGQQQQRRPPSSQQQQPQPQPQPDPLFVQPSPPPQAPNVAPRSGGRSPGLTRPPVPGVGRSDLDPWNNPNGGGMVLDPRNLDPNNGPEFNPGGQAGPPGPRGPRIRFDPYGPPPTGVRPQRGPTPGTGRFANPDPDHLPPPGYDDQFM